MTRSSAVLTRFFNSTFLLLFALSAHADDSEISPQDLAEQVATQQPTKPVLSEEDRLIGERAMDIIEQWSNDPAVQAIANQSAERAQDQSAQKDAQKVLDGHQKVVERDPVFGSEAKKQYQRPDSIRVIYFVTLGMGQTALEDVMMEAAGDPQSVIVIRGYRPESTLMQDYMLLQELAMRFDEPPAMAIDPVAFRDYRIDKAPTVLLLEDDGKTERSRASGLVSRRWLEAKSDAGVTGDLGVRGPLEEIAEVDLIEEMQRRVMNIDWEEKKANAMKKFWEGQIYTALMTAREARVRYIDPTIRVSQDVVDAEGRVIVAAGTQINPLHMRPLVAPVFVFNAVDPRQVVLAKRIRPEALGHYNDITLIASELDGNAGWDGYNALTLDLNAHVDKLPPELKSAFALQYVPALVTQEGDRFRVEEFDLDLLEERETLVPVPGALPPMQLPQTPVRPPLRPEGMNHVPEALRP